MDFDKLFLRDEAFTFASIAFVHDKLSVTLARVAASFAMEQCVFLDALTFARVADRALGAWTLPRPIARMAKDISGD